uniref:Uncharacterized protein n=1 Tax=Romanomermis culicivorax TaxID=13658 RepID=A0A915IJN4_ROMCU
MMKNVGKKFFNAEVASNLACADVVEQRKKCADGVRHKAEASAIEAPGGWKLKPGLAWLWFFGIVRPSPEARAVVNLASWSSSKSLFESLLLLLDDEALVLLVKQDEQNLFKNLIKDSAWMFLQLLEKMQSLLQRLITGV